MEKAKEIRTKKAVKEICEDIIALHESMKNAYFFTPPQSANSRRYYEKKHSRKYDFIYDGVQYCFDISTRCSCKNVYYSSCFLVDGVCKDIRAVKKLLNIVSQRKKKGK